MNPFFSMQSTRRMLPLVQERIDFLLERFVAMKDTDRVVNLVYAFGAWSNGKNPLHCAEEWLSILIRQDVMTTLCFGQSHHRLEHEEFDPSYSKMFMAGAATLPFLKQFPLVPKIMLALPEVIGLRLGPGIADIIMSRRVSKFPVIDLVVAHHAWHMKENINISKAAFKKGDERLNIFRTLLDSDLPASEKSTERLMNEGFVLEVAGSHTVAWTVTVATFHIHSTPRVLRTLKDVLRDVDLGSQTELEKLPYLTAVIKESLRLAYGSTARVTRIAPDAALRYKEWEIPKGTAMSTNIVAINNNAPIFPEPKSFKPERWLDDKEGRLDKYMIVFSTGSRMCLGRNLTWAELYLCLAAVFGNFGGRGYTVESDRGVLELYETDISDVEIVREKSLPIVKEGSKGVRIRIRSP